MVTKVDEVFGSNEKTILINAFLPLYEKLKRNDTVAGTVELIGSHFILDPSQPFLNFADIKKSPQKYIKKELDWYLSQDRCITGYVDDVQIWSAICTKDTKRVNSNYGWCVYSPENSNGQKSQFDFALEQLLKSPEGRQSVIFYNRPQMQWEWNDGINASYDFTCTFSTQHFIRNGKLEYLVYMRSNDAIFGFINDFAWHCHVYNDLLEKLNATREVKIERGNIHWNAGSFHVYERHYELLEQICEEFLRLKEVRVWKKENN